MTSQDTPLLNLNCPVSWEAVTEPPGHEQLETERAANASALRMLHALDDHNRDSGGDEAEADSDLLRLELKMDFMMQMLGSLLALRLDLPPRQPLSLSGQGLRWGRVPSGLEPGALVRLSIYMEPMLHKPLIMYGIVGETPAQLLWWNLSEREQQWLDRLIFRHHRREVARNKKP